jgi:desulfoferrodoxin (superoxide reductase-like protein)
LYDVYWDLVDTKFMQQDVDPIVEFDFDDLWEYEIRVQCSLHGIWWKKFIQ